MTEVPNHTKTHMDTYHKTIHHPSHYPFVLPILLSISSKKCWWCQRWKCHLILVPLLSLSCISLSSISFFYLYKSIKSSSFQTTLGELANILQTVTNLLSKADGKKEDVIEGFFIVSVYFNKILNYITDENVNCFCKI